MRTLENELSLREVRGVLNGGLSIPANSKKLLTRE